MIHELEVVQYLITWNIATGDSGIWIATGLWHYIVVQLFKCFNDSDILRKMEWLLALDIICRIILITISILQLIINFKIYKVNKTKFNQKQSETEGRLWRKFSSF